MATTELSEVPPETPGPAPAVQPADAVQPAVIAQPAQPPEAKLPVLRMPFELRGNSTKAVVLSWLTSRAIALALLVTVETTVTGDVSYYARSLTTLFHGGGIRETLQEYPLPVLGIMLPQYLLGALNPLAFACLFVLSMLAVDAVFTWFLWRVGDRLRSDAVQFWLWFVPAIGPLAYFRFDLVPAMLAGGAVLFAARRPAWSGVLTAIGAGLKLWPALMLPSFLLRRNDRRRVLAGFLGTGIGLGVVSLAVGGVGRVLSPLNWQSARGLQIESVVASPLMIARAVHNGGVWDVRTSRYKAFEIFGWGSHALAQSSTVLTAIGLGVLAWLWLRARTQPIVAAETVGWLFLATAAMVTITNKTLSPQYILWLGGPVAVLIARWPTDAAVQKAGRLLLMICVMTQFVFPISYHAISGQLSWITPIATAVLFARNVALVRLTVLACVVVYHQTKQTPEAPDEGYRMDEAVAAYQREHPGEHRQRHLLEHQS